MDRRSLLGAVIPLAAANVFAVRNPDNWLAPPPASTCSVCRFYKVINNGSSGMCQRYPVNYNGYSKGHPEVKALDWCGEFQSR